MPPANEVLARRQQLIYNLSNPVQSWNPHDQRTPAEGLDLENLFWGFDPMRSKRISWVRWGEAVETQPSFDRVGLPPEIKWSDGRPVTAHDDVSAWLS